MPEPIVVNTGEIAVGHHEKRIRTSSVGSCVVIVLYDQAVGIGGVAHALLPSRKGYGVQSSEEAPAKFADESVDKLIRMIEALGGKKQRLRAKLVGGAQMFKILSRDQHGIGYQNVEAARNRLLDLSIPIDSEDTGGSVGRLVELNLATGLVEVVSKI